MFLEVIGILGGLLMLFAFIQVATDKWNGRSFWYEACNAVSAALLLYYTVQKKAYVNIALNIIWGTVALYIIFHASLRHRVRKKKKTR